MALVEEVAGNRMVVSNGGSVASVSGYVGRQLSSSNNLAIVTGTNSLLNNQYLTLGASGPNNQRVVGNGGLDKQRESSL